VSQPADKFTNLKNEIENSGKYLDIEQVRFGSRLVYTIVVPENAMQASVPALILATTFLKKCH